MNAGGLKGALLTRAYDAKLYYLKETGDVHHRLWDALVFRKVGSVVCEVLMSRFVPCLVGK